jgi:hypothetical protein
LRGAAPVRTVAGWPPPRPEEVPMTKAERQAAYARLIGYKGLIGGLISHRGPVTIDQDSTPAAKSSTVIAASSPSTPPMTPTHEDRLDPIDTAAMIADLYARAHKCRAHIESATRAAEARLERAKRALLASLPREAVRDGRGVQPTEAEWQLRVVRDPLNPWYHLEGYGRFVNWPTSTSNAMLDACDACEKAEKELKRIPMETRDIRYEAEVLDRLAADVRLGRIGVKRTTVTEDAKAGPTGAVEITAPVAAPTTNQKTEIFGTFADLMKKSIP